MNRCWPTALRWLATRCSTAVDAGRSWECSRSSRSWRSSRQCGTHRHRSRVPRRDPRLGLLGPECVLDDLCRLSRHRGSCRRPARTKARSHHRTSRVHGGLGHVRRCAIARRVDPRSRRSGDRSGDDRVWAALGAIGASAGPPIGGLLVAISWRRIFLINIRSGCSQSLRACGCCPRSRRRASRCPKHFRP
jgi:hypothetical protein